jgi:methionine synthase II (cobalamin-independent)
MATNVHAEHVGSLLRPRWLLETRAARKQATLTSADSTRWPPATR